MLVIAPTGPLSLLPQLLQQIRLHSIDRYPLLLHCVAVTNRGCIVGEGIVVNGDTEWCANFVLATVTFFI